MFSLMLTNEIISAINGRDILRPLGVYFRPFANHVVTLSTISGVVVELDLSLGRITGAVGFVGWHA